MNLRHIFRRTRPTPAPTRLDPHEVAIYREWGFTEDQWAALTDQTRAHRRENYLKLRGTK